MHSLPQQLLLLCVRSLVQRASAGEWYQNREGGSRPALLQELGTPRGWAGTGPDGSSQVWVEMSRAQ